MLQHLDEQKQYVQAVLSDRSVVGAVQEESLSLSAGQWNRISSMLPDLEGLQVATTAMCEKNLSASCILSVSTLLCLIVGGGVTLQFLKFFTPHSIL